MNASEQSKQLIRSSRMSHNSTRGILSLYKHCESILLNHMQSIKTMHFSPISTLLIPSIKLSIKNLNHTSETSTMSWALNGTPSFTRETYIPNNDNCKDCGRVHYHLHIYQICPVCECFKVHHPGCNVPETCDTCPVPRKVVEITCWDCVQLLNESKKMAKDSVKNEWCSSILYMYNGLCWTQPNDWN